MMRYLSLVLYILLSFPALAQERSQELLQFAMDHINERQFEVAEQALNKLLLVTPSHRDALFLRGYCRFKSQKHDASLKDLNHLISLDANYVNAYLIRARLHRIKGNYWSSLVDYNRARKLDPYQTFFTITRGFLSETN